MDNFVYDTHNHVTVLGTLTTVHTFAVPSFVGLVVEASKHLDWVGGVRQLINAAFEIEPGSNKHHPIILAAIQVN